MARQIHIILTLLALLAVIRGATAQTLEFLGCKNFQGVDWLNYDELQGEWYEYARTPRLAEDNARCITFVIGTPIDGKLPTKRLQIDKFLFWDLQRVFKAESTIDGAGKGVTPDHFNYTYIYADYKNVVVVYACHDLRYVNLDVIWILTRERNPPCHAILDAYDAIWKHGFSLDRLQKIDQSNCPDNWDENQNILDAIFHPRG